MCFAAIFVSECGPLPVLGNPLLGLVVVFSSHVEIRKLEMFRRWIDGGGGIVVVVQ